MPRRKKHTIPAVELPCFEALVAALKERPELTAGFDAAAIQVIVPERYTPKIKDISKVIDHFQRYVAMNRQYINVVSGDQVITREQLAKMLGISRQTLYDWINKGFVTPRPHKALRNLETFDTDTVLEQLKHLKNS
jgi:predicted DNA-binding transcriptional regulator AlpA